MKLRPLQDRVLVRRVAHEAKSSGGVIIPGTAQEKPMEGEVVAVGAGARGTLHPLGVKAGDRVLFGKWSGTEIKLDGEELMIMKESDIMGVIELGAAKKTKALRVLLLEDDALIATLLSELLVEMGHDVCATAATEAQAVTAAARHRPDLMIVDASLARGSGVSAVEEILHAGPVAHLFVSGDPGAVQVLRPSAVVIRKPFRGTELVKAIESALNAAGGGVTGVRAFRYSAGGGSLDGRSVRLTSAP
jgi:co-chaperonin GroES (HSP10)/CheY-like chemotaxis protein